MAVSDWSERTRVIVTVAVGAAINAGLLGWFYMYYNDYTDLEKKHAANAVEIQRLTKVSKEDLPKARETLERTARECKDKEHALPQGDEVNQLIQNMATLADKDGCYNISVQRLPGGVDATATLPGGGTVERTVWRTRWEADFHGWCKLMNDMEENLSFDRFVSFENLTLQPKNNGMVPTGSKLDISVDVVTYRYQPVRL